MHNPLGKQFIPWTSLKLKKKNVCYVKDSLLKQEKRNDRLAESVYKINK